MAVAVGATVMRDATGNVSDLIHVFNGTVRNFYNESEYDLPLGEVKYGTHFDCTHNSCTYGSQNNFQVRNIRVYFLYLLVIV